MGLFDKFKGQKIPDQTPYLALVTSLVYCMAADGEFDNEEIAYLITVLGGQDKGGKIGFKSKNQQYLDSALEYAKACSVDKFLNDVSSILTEAQKLCIICNMTDIALSDGEAEAEEQDLIIQFQKAFGISDEQLDTLVGTLILKNDRSIFEI